MLGVFKVSKVFSSRTPHPPGLSLSLVNVKKTGWLIGPQPWLFWASILSGTILEVHHLYYLIMDSLLSLLSTRESVLLLVPQYLPSLILWWLVLGRWASKLPSVLLLDPRRFLTTQRPIFSQALTGRKWVHSSTLNICPLKKGHLRELRTANRLLEGQKRYRGQWPRSRAGYGLPPLHHPQPDSLFFYLGEYSTIHLNLPRLVPVIL